MKTYHKIQTVFKRDMDAPGKKKPLLYGQWTRPEFELLQNCLWDCYEKVDGTNIRVMWNHVWGPPVKFDEFMRIDLDLEFRGKTDKAQTPPFLLKKLDELFHKDKFREMFDDTPVCLYGEGYGLKIQKGGGYIPDGVGFILFDVRIGRWWLQREDVEQIADNFNIPIVPLVGLCPLTTAIEMCEYGFDSRLRDAPPEGIVAKPHVELFDRKGERIITKLKLEDFKERS
jgi:hypothetical protein